MSSNIEIQRICEHCGNEFTAKTTTTKYCSGKCSKAAYKLKLRTEKIEKSNKETKIIKYKSIEEVKSKEFLSVKDVSLLLNCSIRSVYYSIANGEIKAINFGQRITRVKRSEIDKLFEQPKQEIEKTEKVDYKISDCYTIKEIIEKFGISRTAVQSLINREQLPKIEKGRNTFVPKPIIDKYLN
jgi:excisionase family DNA binding protein